MSWFNLITPALILTGLLIGVLGVAAGLWGAWKRHEEGLLPPPAPESRRDHYDTWRAQ